MHCTSCDNEFIVGNGVPETLLRQFYTHELPPTVWPTLCMNCAVNMLTINISPDKPQLTNLDKAYLRGWTRSHGFETPTTIILMDNGTNLIDAIASKLGTTVYRPRRIGYICIDSALCDFEIDEKTPQQEKMSYLRGYIEPSLFVSVDGRDVMSFLCEDISIITSICKVIPRATQFPALYQVSKADRLDILGYMYDPVFISMFSSNPDNRLLSNPDNRLYIDELLHEYKICITNDQVKNNVVYFIKADPEAVMPTKAHPSDAGYDLTAIKLISSEDNYYRYDTGLIAVMPTYMSLAIRPRSSIWKTRFRLSNSPGTVDSSYRGTIQLIFEKTDAHKENPMPLPSGKFCCVQLIPEFVPHMFPVEKPMSYLELTARGAGGFGSSDKK